MTIFSSILVPLDGSALAAKSLDCAIWLSGELQSELHVLNATNNPLPTPEALTRLRIPAAYRSRVTLHQADGSPAEAIAQAARDLEVGLTVISGRGETLETEKENTDPLADLGHVTRAVIEQCSIPVLLMPRTYRGHHHWRSALVPVSGEVELDAALGLAARLARALDFQVQVAHVVGNGDGAAGLTADVQYADSPYHEYAGRLQELISRVLSECGPGECGSIEDVSLCRGNVGLELLSLVEQKAVDVIFIGWHGKIIGDHATILKALLRQVSCPLLMVKSGPRPPFELKVGDAIE